MLTNRWPRAAVLLLTLGTLWLGGCHSDAYYQNRAVERARKYLLDEAKGLSAEEKYYITFNDPVFLVSPILGETGYVTDENLSAPTLTDELKQICIAWRLPGSEDFFMVYGVSNGRMNYWYPDRLIRKRFVLPKASGLEMAATDARKYAVDNLFGLMSAEEQNMIRFAFPAVYETNFELNFNPRGDADEETVAKAKEEAASGIQYSLVWERPGISEVAVFCGVGKLEMKSWQLNFAGKTSREELAQHIVAKIKTPEDFYKAFPEPYTAKKTTVPTPAAESQPAAGTDDKEKK